MTNSVDTSPARLPRRRLGRAGGIRSWSRPGSPPARALPGALVGLLALLASGCTIADTAPQAAASRGDGSPPAAPSSTAPADTSLDEATVSAALAGLPTTLFTDGFDDNRHGWLTSADTTVTGGSYTVSLPPGQDVVSAADTLIAVEGELDQLAVATTVTATDVRAVGVECAYDELDSSSRWYTLELGSSGASITKRPLGDGPIETLAANPDTRLSLGTPTTLQALCRLDSGAYQLALLVDGALAVATEDTDPFGAGAPGLLVRGATEGSPTLLVDSFAVTVPVDGPTLP
jgi:hypothetical protein